MSLYNTLPDELNIYIDEWKSKKGSLVMILHKIQDYYGYVPKEICFTLTKELKLPLARIYEVLTFYNYFKLESFGKYKISVCMGTACYLKGAPDIIKSIENKLNIKEGQTSKDNLFSLETVRCMGCCGLAPNVSINGKIYGKLDNHSILCILENYMKESEKR